MTTPPDHDAIALIAHHLLDSVAVIAGSASTVRAQADHLSPADQRRYLDRIEAQALHIGAVLGQLGRGQGTAALALLADQAA